MRVGALRSWVPIDANYANRGGFDTRFLGDVTVALPKAVNISGAERYQRTGRAEADTFHWTNCAPQHRRLDNPWWLSVERH